MFSQSRIGALKKTQVSVLFKNVNTGARGAGDSASKMLAVQVAALGVTSSTHTKARPRTVGISIPSAGVAKKDRHLGFAG